MKKSNKNIGFQIFVCITDNSGVFYKISILRPFLLQVRFTQSVTNFLF